jgi:hypothetical protein
MMFGAARISLLVLLVGAFCAGCGGSGSGSHPGADSSPSEFSTAYKLPATPLSTDSTVLLASRAMLAHLASGRCPPLLLVQRGGPYFRSSLTSLNAVKMIVCRYRGRNDPPPLVLRGSATITQPATVESWRRRFSTLPVVDPRTYHCPADDESAVLAAFSDKNGTVTVAQLSLEGCRFVTIGTITHSTSGSSSLRDDLLHLVS